MATPPEIGLQHLQGQTRSKGGDAKLPV
jgi:hypothetical protein